MKYLLLLFLLNFAILSLGQVTNQNVQRVEEEPETKKERQSAGDEDVLNQNSKSKPSKSTAIQNTQQQLQLTLMKRRRNPVRKTPLSQETEFMEQKVHELSKLAPESFEFHLYSYLKTPYNFKAISHLRKAEELAATHYDVLTSWTAYHFISESDKVTGYLRQLDDGGYFKPGYRNYAGQALELLPENAVLLTHGDNDTYPMLIQQKIKGVRSDISIINIDFFQSEEYLKRLKNKGWSVPHISIVNTEFVHEFVTANQQRNIFLANSIPGSYIKLFKSQIHPCGLAFYVGNDEADFCKKFNLQLYRNVSQQMQKEEPANNEQLFLSNSLPALFGLRNNYLDSGDSMRLKKLNEVITIIGRQTHQQEKVDQLLNQ